MPAAGRVVELRLSKVSMSFGPVSVLKDLDIEVYEGEFLTLLGPSGCGKTTTLNLIAGFFPPYAGTIEIGGEDVTTMPAYRRNTAMVFQNYALFPHLNVAGNVSFGLRMRGSVGKAEMLKRVAAALDLVKMGGMQARYPHELSGGQQQRVALARALVVEPALLLLDEPLSNLDKNLREGMQIELHNLQRTINVTTILVTHDQEEAFVVSDRVAVMHEGRLEQLGTPTEIYRTPRTQAVANFIGRMNWLKGRIVAPNQFEGSLGGGAAFRTAVKTASPAGTEGFLLLRPEHVRLSASPTGAAHEVPGTVTSQVYLGPVTHHYVKVGDATIIAYQSGGPGTPMDAAHVSWPEHELSFMPATGVAGRGN
jgi:ABC-type Fe3+/spermidine/putrescine transport system ATPase subunit